MENIIKRYSVAVLATLALVSCSKVGFEGQGVKPAAKDNTKMDVSCSVTPMSGDDKIMTRSIIGQTTVSAIDANFIKIDQQRNPSWTSADQYRPETTFMWSSPMTRIIDADIMSSPDNTSDMYFRSVVFKPRQTYQYSMIEPVDSPMDTVMAYTSRMVGWYPRTFNVPVNSDGIYADVDFVSTESYVAITDENGKKYDCVKFKNKLDGQTDVMMSDMREGRMNLAHKGFKNNSTDYDIQPYGHQFKDFMNPSSGFDYCNYFTFNHYLSAVRLYVRAENADVSLIAWGKITDVIFSKQPRSVTISLPQTQSRGGNGKPLVDGTTPTLPVENVVPVFGKPMLWEDEENMSIIKTPMAANDPDNPEFAQVPSYPVQMKHAISMDKIYLGYMLVKPDRDTPVIVETDAGSVSLTIPKKCKTKDATGQYTEVDILKPGHIYNIVIDIKTDGTLDLIMGSEDFEKFKNLTPYNREIQDFEYSNCYVIEPEDMVMPGSDADKYYDGYYFHAVTPGCGERGMIEGIGAELYPSDFLFTPHSVEVLWQDHPYLVTQVQLINDFVRFSLNPQCHSNENRLCGNAVIGVYDAHYNLIWSWHIWVTDRLEDITYPLITFMDVEDNSNFEDIHADARYRKELTNVTMMNMNLGATLEKWSGTSDVLKTYGLYYQWGRKDPSPLPPSYHYSQADMSTSPYYYKDQKLKTSVVEVLESQPTVKTGAKHPLDIVAPSQINETYPNDWLYSSVDQLWGYDPWSKKVIKKTIYDPCPYGYRVPDDEVWALMYHGEKMYTQVKVDETSDGLGMRFTAFGKNQGTPDNYFPYAGWRGHDRGRTDKTHAWFNVGRVGDFQDARVCRNSLRYAHHRGRSLIISSELFVNGKWTVQDVTPAYTHRVTTDYANRTSASSVRCVKYDAELQQ